MRWRGMLGAALLALSSAVGSGGGAMAEGGLSLGAPVLPQTPIVTLDQDRLYAQSLYGQRVAREIDAASDVLAKENRALENELEAEERRLTQARPDLPPADFRAQADAFDARVTRTRSEQDAKARVLQGRADQERKIFLSKVLPVLTEIVAERGAVAILDQRAVFLAADSIDITDEALRRIDAVLGAGTTAATPDLPVPTPQLRLTPQTSD